MVSILEINNTSQGSRVKISFFLHFPLLCIPEYKRATSVISTTGKKSTKTRQKANTSLMTNKFLYKLAIRSREHIYIFIFTPNSNMLTLINKADT